MKTLFLINPRAGRRRNLAGLETLIRAERAWEARPCTSIAALDGEIERAEREGFDAVCAVGGDGTASEIGRRLIGRPLALAILPTGSGNGLARHLRIPIDPVKALRVLADSRVDSIDTVSVNGTAFLGVCGIGFDAEIAHRFASSTARGLRTYVRVGLTAWLTHQPERIMLEVDGSRSELDALIVAVANSSQYGNEARIAPLASLQDGLIDVVVARNLPSLSVPRALWQVFRGTLHHSQHVAMTRGSCIVIERSREGPAHVDGEPLILPRRLEFTVRPRSLRVAIPSWVETV